VKHIFVSLLFALHGLATAADTPEVAAMNFAKAIKTTVNGELKIPKFCALNPDTGEAKKQKIIADWLALRDSMIIAEFEIADQKTDGEFAAVVLKQTDAENANNFRIYALGVVKRDGVWLAAPVPSSFENSIVSYEADSLAKRKAIQQWMLGREITLREELQKNAATILLDKMQQFMPAEKLKTIGGKELLESFVRACREKNQNAALAHLGGYSSNQVDGWVQITRRLTKAFTSDELSKWPWRLLADPSTLTCVGTAEELAGETTVHMLALHQNSVTEEPEYLVFEIKRDEQGLARLELPYVFTNQDVTEGDDGAVIDSSEVDQVKLYDQLRAVARAKVSQLDTTKSEALASAIEKTIQSGDFASYWGIASIPSDEGKLSELPMIVDLWQKLQANSSTSLFGRVGFLEVADQAVLVMQCYNSGNADGITLKKIWFQRVKNTWSVVEDTPEIAEEKITTWLEENKQKWTTEWADSLVGGSVRVGGLANSTPDGAAVRDVFTKWSAALKEKNLPQMMSQCATFNDSASVMKMLRNLSGELQYGSPSMEILDVATAGRWGAVCVKQTPKSKSPPQYPLYVFVGTDQGPRLLAQMDFKLDAGRGREFLNQQSFQNLSKTLPEAAVSELRSLYDKFSSLVKEKSAAK
jgi:hypothetical protein